MSYYYDLIVLAFIAWTIFSIYYVFKVFRSKNLVSINPYIYDSIPSVFTTLGVLGTFLGIYFGLIEFEVDIITESPKPLEGQFPRKPWLICSLSQI
jgi:hypothetical protein